ncbi:MAG: hypothetical protein ACJ8FA_13885 [Xanthobacteraceae bacterium]
MGKPGEPREDAATVVAERDQQRREKVADRLVDQAKTRITGANRVLLALFVLIFLSWLNNLSGIQLGSSNDATYWERIHAVQTPTDSLRSSCLDREPQAGKKPRTDKEIEEIRKDCAEKYKELMDAFPKLDTSFDLLQLKLPAVHLRLQPLLLMVLISFTIIYALMSRQAILALINQSIKIYRRELGWKSRQTGVVLWQVPFWLWPVWSRRRGGLSERECLEYLSLKAEERFRPILLNAAAVALLGIAIHVVYVQRELSGRVLGFAPGEHLSADFLSPEQVSKLSHYHMSLSYTGSGLVDIIGLLLVLSPALILMAFGGTAARRLRRSRLRPFSTALSPDVSRRNLVLAGATLAGMGLVIPHFSWSLDSIAGRFLRRSPRIRRKKHKLLKVNLPPGLYRSSKPPPSAKPNSRAGAVSRRRPVPREAGILAAARTIPLISLDELTPRSLPEPPGQAASSDPTILHRPPYHYVREGGTIGGVRVQQGGIKAENLKRAWWTPGIAPDDLSPPSRMEIVEGAAIALVRRGAASAAVAELWAALGPLQDLPLRPKRDLRLYDLLAGLAVRHALPQDLERLVGRARAWLEAHERTRAGLSGNRRKEADRLAGLLTRRIAKWTTPDNAWHKRWHSSPLGWRGLDIAAP